MSTRPSKWQAAANHSVDLKPILSMMSDSSTMLMAKGHRPTPASSPFCVSLRSNSTPQAPMEKARRMKQNDVATSAAKHTAKVFLASADTGAAPVIVASVLIYPPLYFCPGAVGLAGLQHGFDEGHDTRARHRIRREQRRGLGRTALEPRGHALGEIRVQLREGFDEAFGMATGQRHRAGGCARIAAAHELRRLSGLDDHEFFGALLEPLHRTVLAVDAQAVRIQMADGHLAGPQTTARATGEAQQHVDVVVD